MIKYIVTTQHQFQDDKGNEVIEIQARLFSGVSYSDVETQVYTYFEGENFQIKTITKQAINEVYLQEEVYSQYYKVKVVYIIFDEKTQKDKRLPYVFLVNAENIRMVYDQISQKLGEVQDYLITDITTTKIIEVVPEPTSEE